MARANKILYWSPRILGIIFILFVSLFAGDVFGKGFSWLAFIMHLIPSIILIVSLFIAWRHEYVGGIIFIALGVFYLLLVWNSFLWLSFIVVSGPAFLIGVLFLIGYAVLKRSSS